MEGGSFPILKGNLMALKGHCQRFFNAVSTLLQSVNPPVWTIGNAVPCHTEFLYKKYKDGLSINSMQGREAKHMRLQQYAKNASHATRWEVVLKHDFVSNVWLRKCTVAFVGIRRNLIKISARCVPLISTEVTIRAGLGDLSEGLKMLLSVYAE